MRICVDVLISLEVGPNSCVVNGDKQAVLTKIDRGLVKTVGLDFKYHKWSRQEERR